MQQADRRPRRLDPTDAEDIPDRFLFLPIKQGNVRVASFFGLMETTSEAAPLTGPMTLDSWLAADEGDASGLWLQSLARRPRLPEVVRLGPVRRRLGRADARPRASTSPPARQRDSILGDAAAAFAVGRRRAGRRVARRAGRGRVQPHAALERRDAA